MNILKNHFENLLQRQKKSDYNIFSVLHTEHDETRLHSRFISFLLNPNASHGLGHTFLDLFLKNVLNINFDYTDFEIKTEFQFIDILLYNNNDAIIIENKIYAGDSNHKDDLEKTKNIEEKHKGQLARYYHTITSGINKDLDSIGLKRNVPQVVYLTLTGHKPSNDSIKTLPIQPKLISYIDHIANWLSLCKEEAKNIMKY